MQLIEFKIYGGSRVSVNPNFIVDIFPSIYCNKNLTSIRLIGLEEPIMVDADYKDVINAMMQFTY